MEDMENIVTRLNIHGRDQQKIKAITVIIIHSELFNVYSNCNNPYTCTNSQYNTIEPLHHWDTPD